MRLVLAALLALGAVPAQAGPVLSGRVAAPSTNGVPVGNIRAAGAAISVPSVSLTAGLTPSLSPSLAPALPALHSAPSLSADAASVPLQAAVPVPSARAAGLAAVPRFAPAGPAAAEASKPGAEQQSARESLEAAAEKAAAPRQEGESAEAGTRSAGARFDGAGEKARLSEQPAPRGRWRTRGGLGLAATLAGGGALLATSNPTQAVPAPNVPDPVVLELAAGGGLLHAVGQGGYIVGNALAFIFPLFELYRVYQTGSAAATPKTRAALLIGAYLAVGMFVLTLSGLPVWAIQNLFGAATLAAVWPSAWAARKLGTARPGPGLNVKAALATAGTGALAMGLSAGLYYLVAAPFVPALVAAAFGAAAIGAITLGIQIAAATVQALLFAPDLIALYKGKPAGGFSPGFTIALMLASLGFVLYSVVRALAEAPGSTSMWQFVLYAALYTLYTVSSGATWWLGRKRAPRKN